MHKNLDMFFKLSNFVLVRLGTSFVDTILVQTQYTLFFLRNNKYCSETFPYQTWDFLVHLTYTVDYNESNEPQVEFLVQMHNIEILSIVRLEAAQIIQAGFKICRILLQIKEVD